jgi:hypothetical protein
LLQSRAGQAAKRPGWDIRITGGEDHPDLLLGVALSRAGPPGIALEPTAAPGAIDRREGLAVLPPDQPPVGNDVRLALRLAAEQHRVLRTGRQLGAALAAMGSRAASG